MPISRFVTTVIKEIACRAESNDISVLLVPNRQIVNVPYRMSVEFLIMHILFLCATI